LDLKVALDLRADRGRRPLPGAFPDAAGERVAAASQSGLFDEIVSQRGLYAMPEPDQQRLCLSLTREALEHHLENNRAFRAYCQRNAFDASALGSPEDLARLPLLPSSLFKAKPDLVRSTREPTQVVLTTSSGTQGRISTVPRDDVTLMRFFAAISAAVREMLKLENQEARFFNLAPPTAEDPHLWIAYVMAGVGLTHRGDCYVSRGEIQLGRLLRDLRAGDERRAIVGPPPLILDLVRHLEGREPVRLPTGSSVITIGGWKRRSGEEIPRDRFDERVAAAFGLADVSEVRDTFNMVELNSVLVECAARRKHVPPWLTIYARSPKTLEVLPRGESGVLSFVDPSAVSYPAFVLSDDVGRIEGGPCSCGAHGQSVVVERRVSSVEGRGCARKLDRPGRGEAGPP
jgi:long-chain-fatty-acid---luciferin-component ligase